MRWPFRRKGDKTPEAVAPAAPVVVPEQSQGTPRRALRQWTALPPLPVVVKPSAPLVMGPAPVLPPLPGRRHSSVPSVAPATGRVEGLVHPVPMPVIPEPPVVPAEPPQSPPPVPIVHRTVQSRPPEPPPALTEAVGPFVGEPREPAEPYRAPGWLRYAPTWLQGGDPVMDMALGLPSTPEPPPPPRVAVPAKPILPPARVVEEPDEPVESTVEEASPLPVVRPKRRPSLGQSRRLGLGAPIRQEDVQELVLPPEPPAPPAPPRVAAQRREPMVVPSPPQPEPAASEAGDEPAEEPAPAPPPPKPPPADPLRHKPTPPPPKAEVRPAKPTPPPTSVPLVYRSAPGKREKPASKAVPPSLAGAIRGRHGVDVSDVPVHRGPEVAVVAKSLGARAFTKGGEVFLPEEAGSLESPKARGLLAHELVHVVQQRTLGSSLPALSTPAGAALEADAVAAEHEHAGHDHGPELVHPALPQVISQAARTVGVQLAPINAEPSVTISSAPESPPPAPAQEIVTLSEPVRQEVDQISHASATRVVAQWTNPALGGSGFSYGPSKTEFPIVIPPTEPEPQRAPDAAENEVANQILQVINLDRASKGEPSLSALDESTLEQVRRAIAEQSASSSTRAMMFSTATASAVESEYLKELQATQASTPATPASASVSTGVDAETLVPITATGSAAPGDDQSALRDGQLDLERLDLEELTAMLYDRLRSRLRLELLIDRERAGLLTDFR
jgi:hypothetical protein